MQHPKFLGMSRLTYTYWRTDLIVRDLAKLIHNNSSVLNSALTLAKKNNAAVRNIFFQVSCSLVQFSTDYVPAWFLRWIEIMYLDMQQIV